MIYLNVKKSLAALLDVSSSYNVSFFLYVSYYKFWNSKFAMKLQPTYSTYFPRDKLVLHAEKMQMTSIRQLLHQLQATLYVGSLPLKILLVHLNVGVENAMQHVGTQTC